MLELHAWNSNKYTGYNEKQDQIESPQCKYMQKHVIVFLGPNVVFLLPIFECNPLFIFEHRKTFDLRMFSRVTRALVKSMYWPSRRVGWAPAGKTHEDKKAT